MIDSATEWFKMTKISDVVSNIIEVAWFIQYPWPTQAVLDRGIKFMAKFSAMLENYYWVDKTLQQKNSKAHTTMRRIHQTIGNMLCNFEVQEEELDEDEPFGGI